MKRKLLAICLSIVSLIGVGCSSGSKEVEAEKVEKVSINLGVPKAAPTLPILQMIETNAMGDNVELNLDYWNAPEQLIAMTQDNKHDVYALPLTVGAKLYNKEIDIKLTNVNTWGVVYFTSIDESIKEWADLKGEEIYVPQKSSPADILTQYFLESNGLKIGEDVVIKYSTPAEITQLLKAGQIKHGVSLEPQVTNALSGNKNLKIVFSYDEEWKKLMGEKENIPNAGIGATTAFIKDNKDVMKKFEEEYEKALNYLIENPEVAGELGEKHFGLKKDIVIKSMPRLGLMYKDGKASMSSLEGFYKLLLDFDPTTIGGSVPSEDFYYSAE
ncbi:MAG: ABC transporter substrate-binding protein [Clostridioides difficile]|nr:ABC transporter substrate-binding protein [Clostridioides sp.]MBS5787153.1 ABC transporter substrate-binding protein [Clostridioides difficile]